MKTLNLTFKEFEKLHDIIDCIKNSQEITPSFPAWDDFIKKETKDLPEKSKNKLRAILRYHGPEGKEKEEFNKVSTKGE